MSPLAIVLIALAVVLLILFIGGLAYSRRRLADPQLKQRIEGADRALEQARASDRGWDRAVLEETARRALAQERPEFEGAQLHLVLVDDRPGVEEDRAHMVAVGDHHRQARVVLMRDASGEWLLERIE